MVTMLMMVLMRVVVMMILSTMVVLWCMGVAFNNIKETDYDDG